MNHFNYKNNQLFCEKVFLGDIAEKYGTPIYIYSKATLLHHLDVFKKAVAIVNGAVFYSVKALSNINILRLLSENGAGFDIVSGGELHRCIQAGVDPKRIIFSGVGKSKAEISAALKLGIHAFNIESSEELERISMVSELLKQKANIGLRVNPNVDQGGHEYIKTGRKDDKFGISFAEAKELAKSYKDNPHINLIGIACHIGSQILELDGFETAAKQMLALSIELSAIGCDIRFIDMGGGLGVQYNGEETKTPDELLNVYAKIFKDRDEKIYIEPGRAIAANAGMLVTEVEYCKNNFLIVDAAMNDLIRPALYQAKHKVHEVVNNKVNKKTFDIVGPICETGDYLAKGVELSCKTGDLVAIGTAGAYGFSMSSNYNTRPRSAEILVDGDKFTLIRKRETLSELIANEVES